MREAVHFDAWRSQNRDQSRSRKGDVSQERTIGKLTAALLERIASVIRLAAADEAADRVDALGVLAAGVALAFVHVC